MKLTQSKTLCLGMSGHSYFNTCMPVGNTIWHAWTTLHMRFFHDGLSTEDNVVVITFKVPVTVINGHEDTATTRFIMFTDIVTIFNTANITPTVAVAAL